MGGWKSRGVKKLEGAEMIAGGRFRPISLFCLTGQLFISHFIDACLLLRKKCPQTEDCRGGERCAPRFRLITPFCLTLSIIAATCTSSSHRGKLRRNAFRSQGSRPKQRGQGCPHSTSEYLIDTDYHLIIRTLQRRGRPGCWQSSAGTWSSTNTRLCLQAAS
jgi:hypothetical protein